MPGVKHFTVLVLMLLVGCTRHTESSQQDRLPTISELIARDREKSIQVKELLRMSGEAIVEFCDQVGRCPSTEEGLAALIEPPATLKETERTNWRGPYLSRESTIDLWGNPLRYHNIDSDRRKGGGVNLRGDVVQIRVVNGKRRTITLWQVWSVGPDGVDNTRDDLMMGDSDSPVPRWLQKD